MSHTVTRYCIHPHPFDHRGSSDGAASIHPHHITHYIQQSGQLEREITSCSHPRGSICDALHFVCLGSLSLTCHAAKMAKICYSSSFGNSPFYEKYRLKALASPKPEIQEQSCKE